MDGGPPSPLGAQNLLLRPGFTLGDTSLVPGSWHLWHRIRWRNHRDPERYGPGTLCGVTTWMLDGQETIGPGSARCACMMIWQARRMSWLRSWCRTADR